jgi:hypothetical protein
MCWSNRSFVLIASRVTFKPNFLSYGTIPPGQQTDIGRLGDNKPSRISRVIGFSDPSMRVRIIVKIDR